MMTKEKITSMLVFVMAMALCLAQARLCHAQMREMMMPPPDLKNISPAAMAADHAGRNALFRHITSEHDLSGDHVTAILQDRFGFMWIGTVSGLNRYDGYTFKLYYQDPENENSLESNDIRQLYEDADGLIWIVYGQGGFSSFDPLTEKFHHYQKIAPANGAVGRNTYMCVAGTDRWLWFGGEDNILRYDLDTKVFEAFNYEISFMGDMVTGFERIIPDGDGGIWIYTRTGPGRFDIETKKFRWLKEEQGYPANLCGGVFSGLELDGEGNVWIGCRDSDLVEYTPESKKYSYYPPIRGGRPIMADSYGNIWAGSGYGLFKYDPGTDDAIHFIHRADNPRSISSSRITALYEDLEGLIWVGTDNGLNILDPARHQFRVFTEEPEDPNSLSDTEVLSLFKDASGILWVGTDGGGLNRFDRNTWIWKTYMKDPENPDGIADNWVYGTCDGKDGTLWVATGVQLQNFDPATEVFTNADLGANPADPGHGLIESCLVDSRGMLWIGTRFGGAITLDRETGETVYYEYSDSDRSSLSNSAVKDIYEDGAGDIWIGTMEGLNLFDRETGGFTRYLHGRDPVPVNSIREDGDGNIWLGTGNGLCRFDGEEGKCSYIRNSANQEDADNVQVDKHGDIWFTSRDGLLRYNTQFEARVSFEYGLEENRFKASFFDTAEGKMYYGGLQGMITFYPRRIRIASFLPTVLITRFSVNGKPVEQGGEEGLKQPVWMAGFSGDTLTLENDQNSITFEFSALSYANPLQNRYLYILENGEENWHEVGGTGRAVTYPNLKPGSYRFRIKGSSGNGLWNEMESSLNVVIKPLWWKTAWFRGLVVLFAVMFVGGVYKLRVNAIMRRSILLEKMVDERTRELREKNEMIAEQARLMGKLARTDPLTGLANRRDFLDRAGEEFARVDRAGGQFCIVMGDIDFFKKVNDTYGHDAGDYVLEKTAQLMKDTMREQDIKARWGGEEFIMLLPDTDLDQGVVAADKLRRAIENSNYEFEGKKIAVTMTFGVSVFREGTIQECITHADNALYEGKESGRNRVIPAR